MLLNLIINIAYFCRNKFLSTCLNGKHKINHALKISFKIRVK